MARIGRISTIKKDLPQGGLQTMEKSLSAKGYTRMPGTGVFKQPYKEFNGAYRTGLDPDAAYIQRIADDIERAAEIERVTKLKNKLEAHFQVDLGPRSNFWNYGLSTSDQDQQHVRIVKLIDGENIFDLENPIQELTYSWLRVHPSIASSLEAYQRGLYPADTLFYVADETVENEALYKKKKLINVAIQTLNTLTPEKMRKVARQMDLPVSEDTIESAVYNQIDNLLKETEFKSGKYKGTNPVRLFTSIVNMKDNILHVKDLIKQAIMLSVYREGINGSIMQGGVELAKSEEDLVKYLVSDDNQDQLILLEQDIKTKKLTSV